jgi:hypothetical protein
MAAKLYDRTGDAIDENLGEKMKHIHPLLDIRYPERRQTAPGAEFGQEPIDEFYLRGRFRSSPVEVLSDKQIVHPSAPLTALASVRLINS